MKLPAKNKFRAAALMLSLWALFLLSAVVISWALDIDTRISLSGNANRVLEAEAMACSGTEVALHPAVKPGSSVLKGKFGSTQHYEVRITGEGGRLNLNWLLAGENPVRLEMLRRYLEMKGVDLNERDRMIDCLLDWVDPDNLVRLNGAENEGDYQPPNELLTRIDDLKKVKGWKDFTAASGWEDDFTLNSTGPVDVMWASRSVLLALPGNERFARRSFSRFAARPGQNRRHAGRYTVAITRRSANGFGFVAGTIQGNVAPDWFPRPGGANHQHRQIRISYACGTNGGS